MYRRSTQTVCRTSLMHIRTCRCAQTTIFIFHFNKYHRDNKTLYGIQCLNFNLCLYGLLHQLFGPVSGEQETGGLCLLGQVQWCCGSVRFSVPARHVSFFGTSGP